MFEQTFVNAQAETRKPWTMAVSLTLQAGFVVTILLLPLLRPGTITPRFDFHTPLLLTKLTPPPPPPPEPHLSVRTAPPARPVFVSPYQAPRSVPRTIDMRPDPAPEILNAPLSAGAAVALGDYSNVRPLPPPPTPVAQVVQPAAAPAAVRVSAGVQSALLMYAPKPVYPALGKMTRVQGTVRLEAVIGRDGAIRNLHAAGGPALLIGAALEAVSRWRYRPTLLNGEPVEVITEIDVKFLLN